MPQTLGFDRRNKLFGFWIFPSFLVSSSMRLRLLVYSVSPRPCRCGRTAKCNFDGCLGILGSRRGCWREQRWPRRRGLRPRAPAWTESRHTALAVPRRGWHGHQALPDPDGTTHNCQTDSSWLCFWMLCNNNVQNQLGYFASPLDFWIHLCFGRLFYFCSITDS